MEESKKDRIRAYIAIGCARFFGLGALLLFLLFLYGGDLGRVDLGLKDSHALVVNCALSMLFFVQHSGMIRKKFQERLEQLIPSAYQGVCYAIGSGVTLLIVLVMWQETSGWIFVMDGPLRGGLRICFGLSLLGFVWGVKSLTSFDVIGKTRLLMHLKDEIPVRPRLAIRGPYRYVRHPFYFLVLVMIWSCPDISSDRLLFNCLWSLWIVVGTFLEERDLVAEFGADYTEYQRGVPMLFPWKIGTVNNKT